MYKVYDVHPWSGLVLSPDITSKPFNHQQWSQDGKRVKGADQTRPRVMMTGEGRVRRVQHQDSTSMSRVSPFPPPFAFGYGTSEE